MFGPWLGLASTASAQHGEPHPQAYGLDHDRLGKAEGEENRGHDEGCAGDEPAGTLDAEGH
jgi:hypothetical protein